MPEATRSAGPIRCAPKVLSDSAALLARDVTYMHALYGVQAGGASGGVNTKGSDRVAALKAAVDALEPLTADGLMLDAAKGVDDGDLSALRESDPRPAMYHEHRNDLIGTGAAVAAQAARDLDGARIALETLNESVTAFASAAIAAGASIVAIGTDGKTVTSPSGFAPEDLAATLADHGPESAHHLPGAVMDDRPIWAAEADLLAPGSKAGALDHVSAAEVTADLVVPVGAVPITARAVAVLQRQGTTVLPSFTTLAGALPASGLAEPPPQDLAAAEDSGRRQIAEKVESCLGHPEGAFAGACELAEANMSEWWGRLPFGRPMA